VPDALAEMTADPDAEAMARCAARSMPLADFECRHGRLFGDPTPPCRCFPHEGLTTTELAAGSEQAEAILAGLPADERALAELAA
jgi:hypothetical protein